MKLDEEYIPLDTIGFGGYARVVKVRHKRYGYVRALRMINEIIDSEESAAYQSFLEECRTLLRLGNGNHPNIINISKPMLIDRQAAVEMEYIKGKDLTTVLKEEGCFSTKEVIKLLKDISSALAYCHYDIYDYCTEPAENQLSVEQLVEKYRVIHNDIHSKNIMLKKDGSYILLDFGLSFTDSNNLRSSIRRGGVDEYKAPEKWDNANVLTVQSDIYSFGILLYECLAGAVPFPLVHRNSAKEIIELEQKHKQAAVPDCWTNRKQNLLKKGLDIATQDYPAWLDYVILKCLEKDPAKRFANGKELYQYVQHCLEKDERAKNLANEEVAAAHRKEISRYQQQLQSLQSKPAPLPPVLEEAQSTGPKEKFILDSFVKTLEGQIEQQKTTISKLQQAVLSEQLTHKKLETEALEAKNVIKNLQKQLAETKSKAEPKPLKVVQPASVQNRALPITDKVPATKQSNDWLLPVIVIGLVCLLVGIGIGQMIGRKNMNSGQTSALDTATNIPSFVNTTTAQMSDQQESNDDNEDEPKAFTEVEANQKIADFESTLTNTNDLPSLAEIEAVLREYPTLKAKIIEIFEDKIEELENNGLLTERYDSALLAIKEMECC